MVVNDTMARSTSHTMSTLDDRFELIKEIGDGSFGSVALARVRGGGAPVARKGSMVAIKTMKKTFDSFASCLELREVIFLRTLPTHPHLVPALDIFLDPLSRKLHICMEYMDGNLYQLMKARDHKCLDGKSVKSILYQILSGLHHIHAHAFFHRDIKPENILVSTSAPYDSTSTFSRYSALVTPPSTPPAYTIKIADFGLARENHCRVPFTTYVSTRWYRAPEVLLRAGQYSGPVDIWAIGAMAVEIATLKPLFPGSNEVDQVWRVCEMMGSPGNWFNKSGARIGGGEWREGIRLAQKLGFSFPKMAPQSLETVLPQTQWPASFGNFVSWCLMWDPKNRPTSQQALQHEYFIDAVDPLRPKSSTTRLLGRKHSEAGFRSSKEACESPMSPPKPSWFRRSLLARDNGPIVPNNDMSPAQPDVRPQLAVEETAAILTGQTTNKRCTWASGTAIYAGAPMPILPTIRPISPLSNAVTAQADPVLPDQPANEAVENGRTSGKGKAAKIGRQLSVNSHGNYYADSPLETNPAHGRSPVSPRSSQKHSFFSHLRKKARRFSGRHGLVSPNANDAGTSFADVMSQPDRSPIRAGKVVEPSASNRDFTELDKALQSVRYSLEHPVAEPKLAEVIFPESTHANGAASLPATDHARVTEWNPSLAPVTGRMRRTVPMNPHPVHRYETPEEEDELLDEVLNTANTAAARLAQYSGAADKTIRPPLASKDTNRQSLAPLHTQSEVSIPAAYPTPSPTANCESVLYRNSSYGTYQSRATMQPPMATGGVDSRWPTPPYEETEWCNPRGGVAYGAEVKLAASNFF